MWAVKNKGEKRTVHGNKRQKRMENERNKKEGAM
jgi:hypothetical protein